MMLQQCAKIRLITCLCVGAFSGLASAAQELPAHLYTRGVEQATVMLVDKATQQAQLVEMKDDQPVNIQRYTNLLFGENAGAKSAAGDKRTPEGVYQVTRFLPGDELDARYGSGAFPLNYPNPIDQIEGRAGSGIWLHGRDDADLSKVVTRGCVAFTNPDIVALQSKLPDETPVILAPSVQYVDANAYAAERERLLAVLDNYLEAWEAGDFQTIEGLLHPEFTAGDKNRATWLERKKWIHSAVPRRAINAQAVQVLRGSDDQVMYQYTQSYCADNIYTRGTKQLYFKQQGDQLKLLTERFSPLPTLPVDRNRVGAFLSAWLKSWNENNVAAYIRHYDADFKDSKKRDLAAYKKYKAGVFQQRPNQQIDIEHVNVTPLRGNKYRIDFTQTYTSSVYRDKGKKSLVVNACMDDMVIEQETWTAL